MVEASFVRFSDPEHQIAVRFNAQSPEPYEGVLVGFGATVGDDQGMYLIDSAVKGLGLPESLCYRDIGLDRRQTVDFYKRVKEIGGVLDITNAKIPAIRDHLTFHGDFSGFTYD